MKYKVLKQHFGDRQYWAGDVREVTNEQDAQSLINEGLIAEIGGQTGAEGGIGDDKKPRTKKTSSKGDSDESD